MPYGKRVGHLGTGESTREVEIDFDAVWESILPPAIPEDFKAQRADGLDQSGIIDKQYIEWLFESEVVLADLTFNNPNVYYELGIRQALSKYGTILIAQEGTVLPFNVGSQNVLKYDYFNATLLGQFQSRLRSRILSATSSSSEPDSPVHIFTPGLYVKKYDTSETPDRLIPRLENRIAELEEQLSKLHSQEEIDRLREKIKDANGKARLSGLVREVRRKGISSLPVLEQLGTKLYKFELVDEAIEVLTHARDVDPEDFYVLRELGFAYRKKGTDYFDKADRKKGVDCFDKAEHFFSEALRIDGSDSELHGMIGGMLKRQEKYEEALQHYRSSYSLAFDRPHSPNEVLYPLVNLGVMSAFFKRNEEAGEYYQEALKLCDAAIDQSQADHWTHFCRGESAVALGKRDVAFQAYKAALALNPPVGDVRSAAEQLEFFVKIEYQTNLALEILMARLDPLLKK